jgi:predicted TPR repeat methyltransferase
LKTAVAGAAAERHYRRGLAQRDAQRLDAAAACYRRALELKPDHARAHNNLGALLQIQERNAEALASYEQAVALAPDFPQPYLNLGRLHETLGNPAAAAASYRLALANGLQPEVFRHLLAAVEGVATPRAPAQYARAVFDEFAGRFDERLVAELGYRIPEILGARLRAMHPGGRLAILDLGCGTGLCGAHVADIASRLIGVDLSPRMLDQARARNVYHELVEADIADYLRTVPSEAFDAVLSADVFIYLGELDEVFAQVARVLRRGGTFAFSVEECAGSTDYELRSSGRYAQSAAYVRRLVATCRLMEAESFPETIRGGSAAGITGRVFLLRRP